MQRLVYFLFISIFFVEVLKRLGSIGRIFVLFPEILSLIIFITIILYGAINKSIRFRVVYIVIFIFLAIHILFGVILNAVEPSVVFAGLRTYLKYFPLFLLPIIYSFTNEELKKQLLLILFLALLQFPVSLYQRFIVGGELGTGDVVRGTVSNSSSLSIILISCISVLTAFYLKGKIPGRIYLFILLFLFVPTALNETQGAFILLPISILIPLLAFGSGKEKIINLLKYGVLTFALMATFITIYDIYWGGDNGLVYKLTNWDSLMHKLAPISSGMHETRVGRIDSLIITFNELSDDPTKLLFGLGIGNVSTSSLGERFTGVYVEEFGLFVYSAMSYLLWEVGLIGVILMLLFCAVVFLDALKVKSINDINGAISLGWIGVICVIVLSLFYSNIITNVTVSYLFWYFSGCVAATRVRFAKDQELSQENR